MRKNGAVLKCLILVLFIGTSVVALCQINTNIHGKVMLSNGLPMSNSHIYLIQNNLSNTIALKIDSTVTDSSGHYSFSRPTPYYILAQPNESIKNELPTYFGSSIVIQNATLISPNKEDQTPINFSTLNKSNVNKGSASIGGTIAFEKPLEVNGKVNIFLVNKNKIPMDYCSINTDEEFMFSNLTLGTYFLWMDLIGIDNSTADSILLTDFNSVKNKLHFKVDDGSLLNIENGYSNIVDALGNKESIYKLNLSSIQHEAFEKSLGQSSDGSIFLNPSIGEFANMESLNIDLNQINSLPPEIGKLNKLTSFSASINKLKALPNEMKSLKNLTNLNLGKNNFTVFPKLIAEYSSLEILNFANNPIDSLPTNINALKKIKEINLSGCSELVDLPAQIGNLSTLETIDLSRCIKLKTLPKEFINLKNLKVLNVSGTKISTGFFKKAVPECEIITGEK